MRAQNVPEEAAPYPLGGFVERSGRIRYVVHEEPLRAFPDVANHVAKNHVMENRDAENRDAENHVVENRVAENHVAESANVLHIREVQSREVQKREEDIKPLIAGAIDGAAPPPVDELAVAEEYS